MLVFSLTSWLYCEHRWLVVHSFEWNSVTEEAVPNHRTGQEVWDGEKPILCELGQYYENSQQKIVMHVGREHYNEEEWFFCWID